ncbi:hypothetical protein ACO0K9_14210 [Undibacterium sp. Ji50W]|uniref:hypothetical protein n=1 Tax=Undibacterium sp. Ji50W TaxID=3413041 RepID=UPI003BF33229
MKKIALPVIFASTFLAALPARAGSGYYLVSLYENEGEKTIDFKSWSSFADNRATSTVPELGVSYMPNKTWYTELSANWSKHGASAWETSAWTWQNDFLLTHGQYPLDLALHTNLNKNTDSSSGVDFEFGPAMQTDFDRLQVNANVFFERTYRSSQVSSTQMKYQWQGKYRWHPALEFGVLGFGELGSWSNWSAGAKQSHRMGPVISGSFRPGDGGNDSSNKTAVRYDVSYVSGKINAHHASVFSMRLQYAF